MPWWFYSRRRLQPRLPILLLLLLAAAAAPATEHQLLASAEEAQPITLEGCPAKCGETSIPFPFGMTPGCFRPGFKVICNDSFLPPRAFLDSNGGGTRQRFRTYTETLRNITNYGKGATKKKLVELVDVSIGMSEARVRAGVSSRCGVNDTHFVGKVEFTYLRGKIHRRSRAPSRKKAVRRDQGPFRLSAAQNVLVGVGSSVAPALVTRFEDPMGFSPTCTSLMMGSDKQYAADGLCSGLGCCMAFLHPRAPPITSFVVGLWNRSRAPLETTPCSYGMVVESSWYNFSTSDLYGYVLSRRLRRGVPVVLDFAIRSSGESSSSCPAKGQQPPADYACVSGNSSCSDAAGGGYVCKCWDHYQGNPYIPNGCQDIDECEMRKQSPELSRIYPCFGICKNTVGGYDCGCKVGMKGDAKKENCSEILSLVAKVVIGLAVFVVVCVVMVMLFQHLKLKRFYEQNGGPVLKGVKNIRIYKRKQLKQITDNYKHVIGEGHFGKVFKGVMEDKQQVAIKISIKLNKDTKKGFTDEVLIQSEMRHKNIVRLLGCCLEVDVPILMYEYVARGSLYDVLFGVRRIDIISVDTRLGIAVGSAEGLAYMHSAVESTIRHGDVKSANILLDQNFTPKVSDFGTTRLLARGKAEMTDNVIGDLSYIDPVYMEHGVVTQKSDVYSFGVILIELITRSPAVYDDQKRYVGNFVQACVDKQARSFVDKAVTSETDIKLLEMVSEVAVECLKPKLEERLDMKQVEQRLNQIIGQSAQYDQKGNYQQNLSPAPDDIPMLKNCKHEAPRY